MMLGFSRLSRGATVARSVSPRTGRSTGRAPPNRLWYALPPRPVRTPPEGSLLSRAPEDETEETQSAGSAEEETVSNYWRLRRPPAPLEVRRVRMDPGPRFIRQIPSEPNYVEATGQQSQLRRRAIAPVTTGGRASRTAIGFKDLMRAVPQSAVVVTSLRWIENTTNPPAVGGGNAPIALAAESLRSASPYAMTVSSFHSLSVEPECRVTFSISLPSKTYGAIGLSRRFNIHVLRDNEAGARLAAYFAGDYRHGKPNLGFQLTRSNLYAFDAAGPIDAYMDKRSQAVWNYEASERLSEVDGPGVLGSKSGPPLIQGPAVLYVLRCVVDPATQRGRKAGIVEIDHVAIVIGRVLDVLLDPNFDADEPGIVYASGKYRTCRKKIPHPGDDESSESFESSGPTEPADDKPAWRMRKMMDGVEVPDECLPKIRDTAAPLSVRKRWDSDDFNVEDPVGKVHLERADSLLPPDTEGLVKWNLPLHGSLREADR